MCKAITTASKKHFFHELIILFLLVPKSLLKVPWSSRTLRPLEDLQGTFTGRRVLAGMHRPTKKNRKPDI